MRRLSTLSYMSRAQGISMRYCSGQAAKQKTFQNQNKIPALPIADLQESCEVYLNSLKPLAESPQQYETSKKAVEKFLKNEGPVLMERLKKYAVERQSKGESWLEKMWEEMAYLSFREPLPTNSNFIFLFDKQQTDISPIAFAAKITRGALDFLYQLSQEAIAPEYLRKTLAQDMSQYERIFTYTRIPRPGTDELIVHNDSTHIIVIANKQFYKLVVRGQDLLPYSESDILKQLENISQHAFKRGQLDPEIGVVSCLHRDEACQIRAALENENKPTLHELDTALFCVSLDNSEPEDQHQAARWINGGHDDTAAQRWYEKILNFVVFNNGWAGVTGEHTPLDAPVAGAVADYLLYLIEKKQSPVAPEAKNIPEFQPLKWKIDSQIAKAIEEAKPKAAAILKNCEIKILRFTDFGAEWIKSVAKASPDAFAQMSIQLAYYSLHRESVATYETGTARGFLHGRTETVRTLSEASQDWTRAMLDSSVSDEVKLQKLQKAIDTHSAYMKRATDGKGIDRLFLGLRMMRKPDEPVPEMFADPLWRQSTRFRISTSNMAGQLFISGFGPTEPDGYGICYGTRNHMLQYAVSSFLTCEKTDATKFVESLRSSLHSMRRLYKEQAKL